MSEWDSIPLEDLADEITVGFVGSMTQEYLESGIPFLRSKNVEPYRINFDDIRYINSGFHQRIKKSSLKPGDVVIVRTGKPGSAAIIPESLPIANCSDLVVVRPSSKLDKHFLVYYLNSIAVRHINSRLVGAVQQHFNIGDARELKIYCPSIEEQQEIAAVLICLDRKIENLRRQNETLEQIAQTLFKHWFVDFEFPNADGQPYKSSGGAMVPSELGDIPAGWRVGKLGDIADIIDCLHSKKPQKLEEKTGRILLQLNNIKDDGIIDLSEKYWISESDYQQWISRIEVVEGDCVITNVGRVGAVSQIPRNVKAAIGRNMTAIRLRREFSWPSFLIELLLSDFMRREVFEKKDSGTILDALNVKNIPNLRFYLSNREIIDLFESTVNPLRKKMEINLEQIQTLTQTRDTLLPKLMSGQLRVSA